MTSNRDKFVKGASSMAFCNIIAQLLNFYAIIYICNIISPGEYALFGIGMIFFGFLDFFSDLGLGAAIIQKKEFNQQDLNAIFFSICIFSICVATTGYLLSGNLEFFFKKEGVKKIFRFFSLVVVIKGLSVISHGMLLRQLKFHIKAIIELFSKIISILLSLFLVNHGFGAWSLIYAQGFNFFLQTILLYWCQPYRPGLEIQVKGFQEILKFSLNIIALRFVWYLRNTIDKVVCGKLLTVQDFGLYTFAFNIARNVQGIIQLVVNVTSLPALSKLQSDSKRLEFRYLQIIKVLSIVSLPIFIGAALCSDDLFHLFFASKWHNAITIFKVACLIQIVRLLNLNNDNILIAIGKPSLPLAINLIGFIFLFISLVVGIRFGINGIIAAIFIILFFHYVLWTQYILCRFSISLITYITNISSSIFGTLAILLVCSLVDIIFDATEIGSFLITKLSVKVFFSGLFYFLVIYNREPNLVSLLKWPRKQPSPGL